MSYRAYRNVAGSTAKGGEGKGYRADLRKEAVARASAIHKTYGSKKDAPERPLRGGKAKRAAAAAEA
jgi:large subunit ribosomal protein L28e